MSRPQTPQSSLPPGFSASSPYTFAGTPPPHHNHNPTGLPSYDLKATLLYVVTTYSVSKSDRAIETRHGRRLKFYNYRDEPYKTIKKTNTYTFYRLTEVYNHHERYRPEYYLDYCHDTPPPDRSGYTVFPKLEECWVDRDEYALENQLKSEPASRVRRRRGTVVHDCADNDGEDCEPLFDMTKVYWRTRMYGREVTREYSQSEGVSITEESYDGQNWLQICVSAERIPFLASDKKECARPWYMIDEEDDYVDEEYKTSWESIHYGMYDRLREKYGSGESKKPVFPVDVCEDWLREDGCRHAKEQRLHANIRWQDDEVAAGYRDPERF